jgi:hypothetical protein
MARRPLGGAGVCRVRTPIQPSKEVPVRRAESVQYRHSTEPVLQEMKAGQNSKWKEESGPAWPCGTIHVICHRHNKKAPSEQRKWWYASRVFEASILKERQQYDVTRKSENLGIRKMSHRHPLLAR